MSGASRMVRVPTSGTAHLVDQDSATTRCGVKGKFRDADVGDRVGLLASGHTAQAQLCGRCFPAERATPEWITENVQGDVVHEEPSLYVEELDHAVEFSVEVSMMLTADEMAAVDRAADMPELDDLIGTLRDEVLAGCEATARAILERHGARVVVYVQGTKVDA